MWSVVILLIAVMPFIFNFFIKKEFVQSYVYIPILILAMYFSNISGFFGGIFSAYKDTKIMGKSTMIAAIINILINVILIRYIGLWAASFSTLIATFVTYLYRKIKLKKYIKFKVNVFRIFLSWLSLIISIVSYYSASFIIKVLILFILSIYVLSINKEILVLFKNIINQMKIKRLKS